jgi:arsenate reductase-like glutaredoxin family protein
MEVTIMKKIAVLSILILILGVVGTAAPGLRNAMDGEILQIRLQIQIANAINAADLSPEQLGQVYDLAKSTREELVALKERVTNTLEETLEKAISGEEATLPEMDSIRTRMQSIVENYLNGLKSIITVEQAENLADYFSEMASGNRADAYKKNAPLRERIEEERLPEIEKQLRQQFRNLPPEAQERLKNLDVDERTRVLKEKMADRLNASRPGMVERPVQNNFTAQRLAMVLLSDEALEVMEKMLNQQ